MAEKTAAERFHPDQIARGSVADRILTFDTAEGAPGEIPVRVVQGRKPGPCLLILAAVHGDEYDGVRTVIELCRELTPEQLRGTVMMVPVANVPAYRNKSRETPIDGRNLAREFPGDPKGTFTQRLAWHLDRALIARADFLLDYHSAGMDTEIPTLVGYYHNDETAHGRASRAAAEAFGMETVWAHPTVNPGRTISAATARGIPWLYTETGGGRRIRADEQAKYREGAYRLLHHLGMLADPPARLTRPQPPVRTRLWGDGNFDFSFTSETGGFFIPAVRLLDRVRQGDRIGTIHGMFGETLADVCAPSDGVVVALAAQPVVEPGGVVFALTGLFPEERCS
jgi:predicted deacylase